MLNSSIDGRLSWRYKLNENSQTDTMQIAGINLTKNWIDFDKKMEQLNAYVRTKEKPNGVLDYQIYSFDQQEAALDSKRIFDMVPKIYSRETLALLAREELIDLCLVYGINPVNRTDSFICKLILQKQAEMNPDGLKVPEPKQVEEPKVEIKQPEIQQPVITNNVEIEEPKEKVSLFKRISR